MTYYTHSVLDCESIRAMMHAYLAEERTDVALLDLYRQCVRAVDSDVARRCAVAEALVRPVLDAVIAHRGGHCDEAAVRLVVQRTLA